MTALKKVDSLPVDIVLGDCEYGTVGEEKRSRTRPWNRSVSLNVGLVLVFIVMIFVVFPQHMTSYAPNQSNYEAIMVPPSAEHLFGTDNFGRDVFSRVVWGTRIDVTMGIVA
ncbi:MAG: hypothetical protein LBS93_08475, partial [Synergistaceae bacterium]|nr:hypothetical protein [Synergistaceae bacterium]